jgi:hypothetical protein
VSALGVTMQTLPRSRSKQTPDRHMVVLAHEEIVQVNFGQAVTPPILKGLLSGRRVESAAHRD